MSVTVTTTRHRGWETESGNARYQLWTPGGVRGWCAAVTSYDADGPISFAEARTPRGAMVGAQFPRSIGDAFLAVVGGS